MIKLFAIIVALAILLGINFLVSWGLVALAASCFGFAFAWKYVWLVWFVITFVLSYCRRNKK